MVYTLTPADQGLTHPPKLEQDPNDTSPPRSSFPRDIYLIIIPLLNKPALAACCRVSKAFNAIATPHLYSKITISLHKAPGPGRPPPLPTYPRFDAAIAGLAYTTHLTIGPHTRILCCTIPTPNLPNLTTLFIDSHNSNLCTAGPRGSKADRIAMYDTLCPLIVTLRPRRLVLRWTAYSLFEAPVGLSCPTQACPPPWMEELVVLVEPTMLERSAIAWSTGRLFFDEVPSTVERLTLVLQREAAEGGQPAVPREVVGDREQEAVEMLSQQALDVLAKVCLGPAKTILVVGLEAVAVGSRGMVMTAEERVEAVRTAIKGQLVQRGWEVGKAERRAGEVRFVELGAY